MPRDAPRVTGWWWSKMHLWGTGVKIGWRCPLNGCLHALPGLPSISNSTGLGDCRGEEVGSALLNSTSLSYVKDMDLTWCRRLQSVLFLTIVLIGGPGRLGLDALLYHGLDEADRQRVVHVESQGAFCHAEHCVADMALQDPGPPAPPIAATTPLGARPTSLASRSCPPLRSHPRNHTAAPRAPPR